MRARGRSRKRDARSFTVRAELEKATIRISDHRANLNLRRVDLACSENADAAHEASVQLLVDSLPEFVVPLEHA